MVLVNIFFSLTMICFIIGTVSMFTHAVSHYYNHPIAHASKILAIDSIVTGAGFALLTVFGLLFI